MSAPVILADRMVDYDQIIAAYDDAAAELASRYDQLPDGAAFAPFRSFFPRRGRALDIGSGSGRDARWLESLGYEVVGVEPSARLAAHALANSDQTIRWFNDRLPALDQVHRSGLMFDLITLSAVWQHVAPLDRGQAFSRIRALLRQGGVLALSLRTGPSSPGRRMHATSSREVEALAKSHRMEILSVEPSQDLQGRNDVSWIVMILRTPLGDPSS